MEDPDDKALLELHKQHQTRQEKYTYFILAVAASAVAFAVQKTSGLKLSWWLMPVAIAVLSWGVSFFFGCKNLVWVQTALSANYNLLSLSLGVHPEQPPNSKQQKAAESGVRKAIKFNVERAELYATWQFRLLVLGAVFFIVWHILEMYRATYVP